jgi:hypothetical protein
MTRTRHRRPRATFTCGKRRYVDQQHAIRALRKLAGAPGAPIRSYECLTCKGWHLTRTP